jgi:hypothetical protein
MCEKINNLINTEPIMSNFQLIKKKNQNMVVSLAAAPILNIIFHSK